MMKQIQFKIGYRRLVTSLGALVLLAVAAQRLTAQNAASFTLDDKPLRYTLQEGETTLIVRIPNASLLERFALVNENAGVRGELKIAVARVCLPVNDPKWNPVTGNIAFAHKRLFNLSMVGVEAKYVKLSFHVERKNRITTIGL